MSPLSPLVYLERQEFMTDQGNITQEQQQLQQQQEIEVSIGQLFAPEDEALRATKQSAQQAGMPPIQISPIQGKLLHMLALTCNAHKILEIGALAGYSGIWLARALPENGRLITLEIDPKHAEIVRSSFDKAGVSQKTDVRVGSALDLLPRLIAEAPFDLVFIDADKDPYPSYLEWALKLTRPGSIIIVADNTIRGGAGLRTPSAHETTGVGAYNQQALHHPRLQSLALALDDEHTDGFTISVVLPDEHAK